jgi:hypothetical protein
VLQEITVNIQGVAPLIMHNGQTCDPLNKFAKAMKEITGKRKKTEEDHAELSRIEWMAGLYVDDKAQLIIPSDVLDSALVEGAKKSKLGKQFKSAVFVPYDAKLDIGVSKYTLEQLWNNENFRDVRGVRVGTSRVMRTRPLFRDWSTSFCVQFDDEQVNLGDVKRAIRDCGKQVGLCDYRPKYGRFDVVED